MNNKKGFLVSFSVFLLLVGLTIPLFMSLHKKVKAAGDVGNNTISDLTNTAWIFNDNVNFNISPQSFYINFTSNNNSYRILQYVFDEDDGNMIYYIDGGVVYRDTWLNTNYKTITISSGNDVTNSTLISWLQNNATLYTPTPTGTEITHKYWAPDGVITLTDNQQVLDENIQYTVLYNEFNDSYEGTTQTGLNIYNGYNDSLDLPWSYINTANNNSLYNGASNNINNAMWLEFTLGDYMDTELYDFMELWGTWFDDQSAYLVGINQGYVEGIQQGRSQGQADGVQYTNLVSRIFNGIGNLLSIEVFPNITIGLIIGLPLLLGVFVIIIKILRG